MKNITVKKYKLNKITLKSVILFYLFYSEQYELTAVLNMFTHFIVFIVNFDTELSRINSKVDTGHRVDFTLFLSGTKCYLKLS